MYNSLGRKALKHNTAKVSKDISSIQGKWTELTWSHYGENLGREGIMYMKNEFQKKKIIPEFDPDEVTKYIRRDVELPQEHRSVKSLRKKSNIVHHGAG